MPGTENEVKSQRYSRDNEAKQSAQLSFFMNATCLKGTMATSTCVTDDAFSPHSPTRQHPVGCAEALRTALNYFFQLPGRAH